MFTVNRRPAPRFHRRDFAWETVDGRQVKSDCTVKAVALRAVSIADLHVEKGDLIDLTPAEFAAHAGIFEKAP